MLRSRPTRLAFAAVLSLLLCGQRLAASARHKPRVVFNDDGQVIAEAPAKDTVAFVKDWLDRETAFVPFDTFVFLAATPDICLYDSKAGEPYGARFGPDYNKGWAPGMRALRAEGTDPLELVTRHMKSKGYRVLAAVRMNDTHHRSLDPKHPLCSQFAIDHPEYVIKQPDGRTNETALDYSHHEVRQHRLAIMREIATGYDVDGLELNFVRWAKHFPRDQGRDKAPILTRYLSRIRKMLDEAGARRGDRPLMLGVRVPESVPTCWLAGIDIETWAKQGLIDYIVAATWNNTDPQLPVEQFARFAGPAGIPTLVLMGNMIGAPWKGPPRIVDRGIAISAKHTPTYLGMLITPPEARAAAANYDAWGADGISLWNVGLYFGNEKYAKPEQRQRIRLWTNAVVEPDRVWQGLRWYHYLPMGKGMGQRKPPVRNYPFAQEGHSPLGRQNSPVLVFSSEDVGKRLVFPFRMADGRRSGPLEGMMRFPVYHLQRGDELVIDINGKAVSPALVTLDDVDPRTKLTGLVFEIDLGHCPPFRGDNELGLTWKTQHTRKPAPYMEELSVIVTGPLERP